MSATEWALTYDSFVLVETSLVMTGASVMPLRIVVLTYPCAKTLHLLDRLAARGLVVETVLLQRSPPFRRVARLVRQLGIRSTGSIGARRLRTELSAHQFDNPHRLSAYRARAGQLVIVPDMNSDEAVASLQLSKPDIGIVGCAGILRTAVTRAFRLGVLNIHPGMTPQYRGLSPLEWTILEGAQPGVTVHFIDAGIDTGPIVHQREVPVRRGDDFDTLYHRTHAAGFELLASSLEMLQRGDCLPSVSQKWEHTKLRHPMHQRLRRVARDRLRKRALLAED